MGVAKNIGRRQWVTLGGVSTQQGAGRRLWRTLRARPPWERDGQDVLRGGPVTDRAPWGLYPAPRRVEEVPCVHVVITTLIIARSSCRNGPGP